MIDKVKQYKDEIGILAGVIVIVTLGSAAYQTVKGYATGLTKQG